MKVIYQYFIEKIDVLQRLIQELYDEIARCQQNNFRLKSNLNDLRKRLRDKDFEIEQLKHHLKYQKKEARRNMENIIDENIDLKNKVANLNDRIFHAKAQEEEAICYKDNLLEENIELKKRVANLNDRIFHAKVQKEGLLFDLQSKDLTIKELKKKLQSNHKRY